MGLHFRENEEKITLGMIIAGIVCIAVLIAVLIIYLLNVSTKNNINNIEQEQIGSAQEDDEEFEKVSIDIGKKVEEAENELNNSINDDKVETENNKINTIETTANETNTTNTSVETSTKIKEKNNKENVQETTNLEKKEEIKFNAPIKGEIIREFAPDSLVYSATLEEWITHNGIDIKADKTSVVSSCSKGKVISIKNDPRYGITVIVEHEDGYKSVYANLLTAEYVVEGEEIELGQTIGTIGNSASFEVADDYHLHFELLKNGEYVNPENLMSFE